MMEGMKSYIHSLHLGTPVEKYRISNSIYHRDEITYTTFLPQWILKIMLAWKEENEEKIPASTRLRDCLRRQNNRQRRLSSVKEETAKKTQLRFQVGRGSREEDSLGGVGGGVERGSREGVSGGGVGREL
ncbi:hypothetical protein H6P81_010982 [Aristolochia fimbriata]|uniref:Uncharacterized protein n=1 Tax=Aristolochia fimbriata TaxID=158543 RepID=A0AAV7ETP8_ARIFI|nr:hypothetical protein H6P81_010982 [Aristolochia fimbriata]